MDTIEHTTTTQYGTVLRTPFQRSTGTGIGTGMAAMVNRHRFQLKTMEQLGIE